MIDCTETICVVVVTFNRKSVLKKCLCSLFEQTQLPNSIVVVDNASTDGTADMLRDNFQDPPLLQYLNLGRNLGGAGGFYYGTKFAFEKGADWICLMDDDCSLHKDCIKKLMMNTDDRHHIYAPIILSIEDQKTVLWGIKAQTNTGNSEVVTLPFNGYLIHRDTVAEIGYPDKDFFIYGDDADYNFRARASGRKIVMVTASIMYHPVKNTLRGLNLIKLFLNRYWVYYKLRNAVIVFKRHGYFSVKQLVMFLSALFFHLVTFNFRFIGLWVVGLTDGLKSRVFVKDFDK